MGITTNKIKNMSDPEKMQYYLKKIQDLGEDNVNVKEIVISISNLAKNTPIEEFLSKFGLTGSINTSSTPATISIDIPGSKDPLVLAINNSDRKDFVDAQPVEKQPVSSYLTPSEIEEIMRHE